MDRGLQNAFYDACSNGNLTFVEATLSLRSDSVDLEKKRKGNTPLLAACWEGNEAIVGLLIRAGADVNAQDDEEFSCLHVASFKGYHKIIVLLLDNGARIEALDDARSTPFAVATLNGHYKAMRLLARRGANVSPMADDRVTPLSLACCTGSETRVRVLLQLGADPRARGGAPAPSPGFVGPLARNAVFSNAGESCLLQVMLYLWPSPKVPNESDDGRLAREDLLKRHLSIAEMLIAAGADLNQRHMGNTPIHVAAGAGSRRLMTALLRAGASTSTLAMAANGAVGTPLFRAAMYCRPLEARLLLHHGADELALDGNGLTPLEVVGALVTTLPPVPVEEIRLRGMAVAHALFRGPAFRARSWLWPVATAVAAGGGVSSATETPSSLGAAKTAGGKGKLKQTTSKAGRAVAAREGGDEEAEKAATKIGRVFVLQRHGERRRERNRVVLSAMWRLANKRG